MTHNHPAVSIVVPVHNAEQYIGETIESVQRQTFTDWELILVDDASTDQSVEAIRKAAGMEEKLLPAAEAAGCVEESGSTADTGRSRRSPEEVDLAAEQNSSAAESRPALPAEVKEKTDPRIRLITRDQNQGAAAARNTGTKAARGRYLAFLDADDLWYPEKLERELRFMQKESAPFVFTSYQFGDENGRPTGKAVHVPRQLTFEQALTRTVIFTSTVLIDREKIPLELQLMPEIGSEDTATWWRILQSGITAKGLDELLVVYRRPAATLSSNKGKAVKRIWNLYRQVAGLGRLRAVGCLAGWAWRAAWRRTVPDRADGGR